MLQLTWSLLIPCWQPCQVHRFTAYPLPMLWNVFYNIILSRFCIRKKCRRKNDDEDEYEDDEEEERPQVKYHVGKPIYLESLDPPPVPVPALPPHRPRFELQHDQKVKRYFVTL